MSIRDITAVIASFKSGEIIKSCLNSINRECKVILVENSNDLDFKRKIEQEFSNGKGDSKNDEIVDMSNCEK